MSEFPSEVFAQRIECKGAIDIGELNNINMAPNKVVDMGANTVRNVADPRDGISGYQDAATKRYVDTIFPSRFLDWLNNAVPQEIGINTSPQFVNMTLTNDLSVQRTTTTDNLFVKNNLIEINNSITSNTNDSGLVIERGNTGDNLFIGWDESEDKFVMGSGTFTGSSEGNLSITKGTLLANLDGNITGNAETVTMEFTPQVVLLNYLI